MTEENSEIKQSPELHSDRNGTLKYNKVRISNPWWKVIMQLQKKKLIQKTKHNLYLTPQIPK